MSSNLENTDNITDFKSNTCNINYQLKLDETINEITKKGIIPTLLIHSCCAPCSSYCLEYLSRYFSITVLYYNPNIFPEEEYNYRIHEQQKLLDLAVYKNPVSFIKTPYTPDDFYTAIKGYENEKEGGKRCTICYRLRLEYAAKLAHEMNFDYFTTTLSISPMKDAKRLNNIGLTLGKLYDTKYLVSDFKKRGGYQRSVELSKEYGLYRQDFCGCVYSKIEREKKLENAGGGT